MNQGTAELRGEGCDAEVCGKEAGLPALSCSVYHVSNSDCLFFSSAHFRSFSISSNSDCGELSKACRIALSLSVRRRISSRYARFTLIIRLEGVFYEEKREKLTIKTFRLTSVPRVSHRGPSPWVPPLFLVQTDVDCFIEPATSPFRPMGRISPAGIIRGGNCSFASSVDRMTEWNCWGYIRGIVFAEIVYRRHPMMCWNLIDRPVQGGDRIGPVLSR